MARCRSARAARPSTLSRVVRALAPRATCAAAAVVATAGTCALAVAPAAGQERPTLTPEEYGRWERLGSFLLDPTGRWLVASITRVDERTELRVHRADGATEPLVLEHGSDPEFSRDGRWLAYRKGPPPEDEDDAEEEGEEQEGEEPPPDTLGLVDLGAASDTVFFAVSSFAFRDDGAWLAARAPAVADTVGGDLVVLRPSTGERTVIGNVDAYAWQDDGPLLGAILRTAGGVGDGVVVFDPDTGTLRTLASADARFRALTWREESAQLAVLRSVASDEHEEETHDVLVWEDVTGGGEPRVLDARGTAVLADTMRIAESGGIRFGQDGRVVFVGLRPWTRVEPDPDSAGGDGDREPDGAGSVPMGEGGRGGSEPAAGQAESEEGDEDAEEEGEDEVGPADVQVWHWNDDLILRAQEYSAEQIADRTLAAAWHLEDDRLVVLARELDEPVRLLAGGRWAVAPDYDP